MLSRFVEWSTQICCCSISIAPMTLSSGSDTASNVCSLRMTWKVWQPFATVWILMKVCGSTKCNSRPRLVSSGMMLSGYGDQALAVLSQPNLYMIHDEHNLWRNPPTPSRHRACEGPGTRSPAPKHPASSHQAQPASHPVSKPASQLGAKVSKGATNRIIRKRPRS